jgi:hypothetical protein
MDPINETHVSEPVLVVLDVAAVDDATTRVFQRQPLEGQPVQQDRIAA